MCIICIHEQRDRYQIKEEIYRLSPFFYEEYSFDVLLLSIPNYIRNNLLF